MRGNDLIFTLREGVIFAINKLSRMRVSNSEQPLAKTEKSSKDIGRDILKIIVTNEKRRSMQVMRIRVKGK